MPPAPTWLSSKHLPWSTTRRQQSHHYHLVPLYLDSVARQHVNALSLPYCAALRLVSLRSSPTCCVPSIATASVAWRTEQHTCSDESPSQYEGTSHITRSAPSNLHLRFHVLPNHFPHEPHHIRLNHDNVCDDEIKQYPARAIAGLRMAPILAPRAQSRACALGPKHCRDDLPLIARRRQTLKSHFLSKLFPNCSLLLLTLVDDKLITKLSRICRFQQKIKHGYINFLKHGPKLFCTAVSTIAIQE